MSRNDHEPLSQDTVFDLLSNTRRRYLLKRLSEIEGGADLGDLATDVAAMENDVSAEEVTTQQRKRTYVSLYQTHVPKLVEAGVVDYDRDAGTVQLASGVEQIAAYFDSGDGEVFPWHRLYLAVSGIGFLAYGALIFVDATVVDPVLVGGVVLLLLVALSAVHFVREERSNNDELTIPVHIDSDDR